ncbi:DsbA family protein [Aromatoleum sp.]|uniref:DsbA family protein n=1 Tax=Aromatoleum sp. TaxID=2307007 RepID=UPI002FC8B69F
MKEKTLFLGAAAILLLVFVVATMTYNTGTAEQSARVVEQNRDRLVRMHSPTLGNAQAKVQIVEFLDPACETCRSFYPFVKEMMAANPEDIRLVVRYAPFHDGSEAVVAVLEAARKQGKFWPTLEALFATQEHWAPAHAPQVDLVWPQLEGLGLDLDRLRADMVAPEIGRVIGQDLADAEALNVTKTPEFFVNGEPLPRFGYEPLKAMVDAALAVR